MIKETTDNDNENALKALEKIVIDGDLNKLSTKEKILYYDKVCSSLGLNPYTRPFDYIMLDGKLVLYAKRDATEQLRKKRGISIKIVSREQIGDIYVVQAHAQDNTGRYDESIGAVNINGLKENSLANAFMKAETKAKRRVTLSISGLGWIDETEIETIKTDARLKNKKVEKAKIGNKTKQREKFIEKPASDKQRKMLYAMSKQAGMTDEEYKNFCEGLFNEKEINSDMSSGWHNSDVQIIKEKLEEYVALKNTNENEKQNIYQ